MSLKMGIRVFVFAMILCIFFSAPDATPKIKPWQFKDWGVISEIVEHPYVFRLLYDPAQSEPERSSDPGWMATQSLITANVLGGRKLIAYGNLKEAYLLKGEGFIRKENQPGKETIEWLFWRVPDYKVRQIWKALIEHWLFFKNQKGPQKKRPREYNDFLYFGLNHNRPPAKRDVAVFYFAPPTFPPIPPPAFFSGFLKLHL